MVNEGTLDRVLRVVIGILLGLAAFFTHGALQWVLAIVAVVAVITGATGFCAVYRLLGIRTCPVRKA